MWGKILGKIVGPLFGVIDKAVTDKDLANTLKHDIQSQLMDMASQETKASTAVLLAEIQGASWLQRNWRPLLMLTVVFIIANNYILFPYMQLLGLPAVVLELPDKLYTLMVTGVGGYVVGRTGEKMMETYKGAK